MEINNSSIFETIVNRYEAHLGDDLVSIVLFGSRARGEAKERSDYDLFIIAKGLPEKAFKRVLYIRTPLSAQFEERICIIAKTPDEIMKDFPALFLDLGLDGILLFDRNDFFKNVQTKIRKIIDQAGLERKKDNEDYYWKWRNPPKKGWEITWGGYREL